MVDLTGQNHALEQVLQSYGEHTDSCGVHWKGPAASGGAVGEDSILAALDRVPVDEATNSRATPEALAKRVALVDEFERLAAAFAVGDKVVVDGLKAKPKYNGKTATVRTRCNARGRYAVTIAMRDGPETIALKVANLRIAADAA